MVWCGVRYYSGLSSGAKACALALLFGLGFAGALGNKILYDYETFTQGNYYGGESTQGLRW